MPKTKHTDNANLNHLLAALPDDELKRMKPSLDPVRLKLGEVIYESGEQLEYICFPTTAVISLVYIIENGSTAEIRMAGNGVFVSVQDALSKVCRLHRSITMELGCIRTQAAKVLGS